MDFYELMEYLDIEDPAEFIYFETMADLVESERPIDQEAVYALFDGAELETVAELFDDYLNEDYNKDDVQVGHTMFLAKNEDETKLKFIYQVLPILREYYKDGILVPKNDNNIIEYLLKFGKKDAVPDEDLWKKLLDEYNTQNNATA